MRHLIDGVPFGPSHSVPTDNPAILLSASLTSPQVVRSVLRHCLSRAYPATRTDHLTPTLLAPITVYSQKALLTAPLPVSISVTLVRLRSVSVPPAPWPFVAQERLSTIQHQRRSTSGR